MNKSEFVRRCWTVGCVAMWLMAVPTHAQQPAAPQPADSQSADSQSADLQPTRALPTGGPDLTKEEITARKKQLDESANLSDAEKAQATKYYDEALDQLKLAEEFAAQANQWQQLQQKAPQEVQQLKAKLAEPSPPFILDVPPDAKLSVLDQMLATARQELTESEQKLQQLHQEPKRRGDRRATVNKRRQSAAEQIAKIDEALKTPSAPGTSSALLLAEQTLLTATRRGIQRELEALAAELPAYDVTVELLELETKLAQREVSQAKVKVEAIAELVARRRQQQANEQEREARLAAVAAHPSLKTLAEQNVRLTQLRTGPDGLTAKIKSATKDLEQAQAAVVQVHDLQLELTEKLQDDSMVAFAGPFLLQVRSELPRIVDLQRKIYDRNQELAAVRFQLADTRRRVDRLADVEDEVATLAAGLNPAMDSELRERTIKAGAELLEQQHQLLKDLETDLTAYFNLLIDLNGLEQELEKETQQVQELVDDQLMWVQAHGVFKWANLKASGATLRWLTAPSNWRQVAQDCSAILFNRPLPVAIWLLLFSALAMGRRTFRIRLTALGRTAASSYLAPFSVTPKALGFSLLLTLIWPTLVFGLGLSLYSFVGAADFTRAVGAGLIVTAAIYLVLELTRRLLGPNGLAEAHFRWKNRRIRIVRHSLSWMIPCALPLVFIRSHIRWEGDPQYEDSLGRLTFMLAMILASVFMQRVLRTLPPEVAEAAPPHPKLTSRIIYRSAILLPWLLLLLSFIGYHFTAQQLARSYFATACLGLGVLIFHGMAVRWLRLVRGTLAIEQARLRREARQRAAEADQQETEEAKVDAETDIDLEMINIQTRRLLQVCIAVAAVAGLWLIWLDVLPSHEVLEQPVWSTAREVSRVVSGAEAAVAPQIELVLESDVVTRADLLLAVLIMLVALLASRNIPGLIEVSMPPQSLLDAGARYALSTILRYILVVGGVILAASIVGITWSKIQWLVAALSVGVGFGLQELVGNFVSGLILLFERPVRVGDIVTVDGVTGTVTRVQIRATTIRNWDQQEYIVPNKDLITGRVLNWTLTSAMNRITINVGVAYGSDARRVRELLIQLLNEHENVMEEPAPLVTFEEFGDSALQFVARAYLNSLDWRLATINDLHTIIHERFAEEGIEISFPQRDIHIRNLPSGVKLESQHTEHPPGDMP